MPKHIARQTKEALVEYYKTRPMTIEDAANKYNICTPSAIKILDEYRIKRYTKVQLFSPDLNEHYFDSIDTEEKAYFLGLILTDGCIHKSKGKQPLVNITLQECDKYILEKFKKEIRSNKTITSDGRGCSQINILSNSLVNGLRKYGITENKSLNTKFPMNIQEHLYRHLIRGILDGDGSISFYARQNKKCHIKAIRFCQGNEKFLSDLVDFLYDRCRIEKINTYQEKDSLWSITYRKNDSMIKLIHYIYNDAHIYLKRKKHFCDLIYDEITRYGNTEITTENKKSVVS